MDPSSVYKILPTIIPFPLSYLSTEDGFGRKLFNDAYTTIYKQRIVPMIALAHLTGWSAELIAKTVTKQCGSQITPEMVWDIYKGWEAVWDEKKLEPNYFNEIGKEFQSLLRVLAGYRCSPKFDARPLSKTPRPITVQHTVSWRPVPFTSIIDDDTDKRRMITVGQLSWSTDPKIMSKPASAELEILENLGGDVLRIIEDILPSWVENIEKIAQNMPFKRRISDLLEEVSGLGEHVSLFHLRWEKIFGKMADLGGDGVVIVNGVPCIDIISTGSAAKWFFSRMLTNRLSAMDSRRDWNRQQTGFVEIAPKDLPEDVTDCLICLQRLGVPGPDGKTEMPVRVMACCGNYFGIGCLREWYREYDNDRCPICRQTMPPLFVQQLCGDSQVIDHDFSSRKGDTDSEGGIEREGAVGEDIEEGEIVEEIDSESLI